MKEKVAEEIAGRVKDGDLIGVGTGSTVDCAVDRIAARVRAEGISLRVVPTSYESAWKCEAAGLAVVSPMTTTRLAWGFDGADEVDPHLSVIKGKGGAMLKEKLIARRCERFVIIVDESKLVQRLGERFPVPVEVIPEARGDVERALVRLGAKVTLREGSGKHGSVISEAGNIILDAAFPAVEERFEREIKCIPGVVESGLFVGYVDEVLVGGAGGVRSMKGPVTRRGG